MILGLDNRNIYGTVTDFTCGYCSQRTGYNIVYADRCEDISNDGDFVTGRAITVLECRACKMLNLITLKVMQETNEYPMDEGFILDQYLEGNPHIVELNYDSDAGTIQPIWIEVIGQYPAGLKFSINTPQDIQQDSKEAANCLAVEAAYATLSLCRKVIERIAIHCGITPEGQTLGVMIGQLKNRQLISSEYIIAFQEINKWGIIGAHVKDEYEIFELEDAREVFNQVLTLVDRYFNQPEIKKISRSRESRKKN